MTIGRRAIYLLPVVVTKFGTDVIVVSRWQPGAARVLRYTVCPKKSEPLNILQQQPQICSDLNKILHTQNDICYKHYYLVLYKSALTLLKYEFLNNITHKS